MVYTINNFETQSTLRYKVNRGGVTNILTTCDNSYFLTSSDNGMGGVTRYNNNIMLNRIIPIIVIYITLL